MDSGEPVYRFCKKNGISYAGFWKRIEKGMCVNEAIKDIALKNKHGRSRNNCKYVLKNGKTLRSECIRNQIWYSACFRLVEKGYTPDEALELILKKRSKNDKKN